MPAYQIETRNAFEPYVRQEWLLTNGLGSYVSGTVIGCNTRRYHSLLCAALRPPSSRHVMLSRMGEMVFIDGKEPAYELSVNQFEQNIHPRGHEHLVRFELDDVARWIYEVGGVFVEKEVLLCWGRNVTGIRYTVRPNKKKVRLELLPFVAMRDFHSLRHGTDVRFQLQSWGNHATITDHDLCLHLASDKAKWVEQPYWWYGHVYPVEMFRGLDWKEELWNPGRFVLEAEREDAQLTIWASTEHIDMPDWQKQLAARREARAQIRQSAPSDRALGTIWQSTDDYIAFKTLPGGRSGKTIIAGFPWFQDWGRDTMISLPGLLLSTRRYEDAYLVLSTFAEHVSEGMIPNRFDDYTGEPSYNTVDASLWFIHAVFEYRKATGDEERVGSVLLPACRKVVEGYRSGTRYFIRMDEADGLITQGDPSTQLTWMDAKCDGVAFTPRQGKPVEINALWYQALVLLGETELAAKVKESFLKAFWISPFRGLADVVEGSRRDASIRPNQVIAASLPESPLDLDQTRAVVEVVRRELLTPYGLRTLSPGDSRYCGRIEGGPRQRDAAYHNGTVWPWLMGPFIEAYLKGQGYTPEARVQARKWLEPLISHMDIDCLGHISEVFDGDAPHRPGGCFAQAWSVAEVLRALLLIDRR